MLISDNTPVRKNYFDSNRMKMQGYCDVYKWTLLRQTSPEVKCLHPTSSRREMCTLSVNDVNYQKFSHGAASYILNGKNVNIMLEFIISNKTIRKHSVFLYFLTPDILDF